MSHWEKSDAQLDAEAQARKLRLDKPQHEHGFDDPDSLEAPAFRPTSAPALEQLTETATMLRFWQAECAAEPPLNLASSGPPEMSELVDGVRERKIDHGAGVGVSMSGAILRYLEGSGGHQYPVHDVLMAWDRYCRSKHARWADHRGRPVCAELAWHVIRDRWSILGAAREVEVSFVRAERLLMNAARWMSERQEQWMRRMTASATHDRDMCEACRREDSLTLRVPA